MKMKKYMIGCTIWFLFLTLQVTSKTEAIQYEIYFDHKNAQTQVIKDEILQRYATLVQGVHEESAIAMVLHNLAYFSWDDVHATWKNNRLSIVQGDGQGAYIQGDLEANSLCFPTVKPKSWIAELFQ